MKSFEVNDCYSVYLSTVLLEFQIIWDNFLKVSYYVAGIEVPSLESHET